jgi:nucleotide-binding universal stress UspA family protein
MSTHNISSAIKAKQDFERLRRLADLKLILARFTGQSIELLSYQDVRQKLKAYGSVSRGLQNIPLDAIIGSVERYNEFTRDFLPLQDELENRWVKVKVAVDEPTGLPDIEVYKISDVYFVLDGHHRVSVARQIGSKYIQANVIEVNVKVPITPDLKPDDLIIKSEYATFLERYPVDKLLPGAELIITAPGGYRILEDHIQVHRYYMGIELERYITPEEAFEHWYYNVYLPIAQTIRERGILRDFPNRTETDLYLWIASHRALLQEELGWEINSDKLATHLSSQHISKRDRLSTRLSEKIMGAVIPIELEAGPPPGEWRRQKLTQNGDDLFSDILIPIGKALESWTALELAQLIAQKENSHLHGLHIVASDAEKLNPGSVEIKQKFDRICQEAGVAGSLAITVGKTAQEICDRARWVDLLVVSLNHPPPTNPSAKLSSGFSTLIRRCPRPLLAVPGSITEMESALLAFDGSPKSEEALYLSAYLASKWGLELTVITVVEPGKVNEGIIGNARDYLENLDISAQYILESGQVVKTILDTAHANNYDLIILGGYGKNPLIEIMLGSSVDKIIQECSKPMLICR